ncbi:hypothetical protein TVAG_229810 [Trichomonas vaginalis G3]|uniref:Uncharacterized protein n=1 Tax=Trichomonas vaginalis (strain ATCC PRA-98 / G3) TaxID=412133 RepID=A2G101_TRIV3|nr:hypothetical protein TVAGG3_1043280 [Trichomonas vaginalis G3]EAX89159.1 hypothetical protein TVAG_229810 [Trichomonas vaginalis G3]KAI5493687.1 hypothetical protein TVAGG3_1043280 [Trichomonas vaginalis G3]|eukprot:XP_001302089.1 hypothetical protein [Trichomonas vaginalis G3]
MRRNIRKAFYYALKPNDKPYVLASYKILTVINNAFVQDIIDNNLILEYYPKIFQTESPNTLLISRYSMLATVTLSASVKNSEKTCQIFVNLLNDVNFLATYYLYHSIYTFPDRFVRNRQAIVNLHLEVLISQYIRRIDASTIDFNNILDPTTSKLVAWYNLIKVAIDNNVYDKQFVSDDVWQSLSIDAEVPQRVHDARWDAISSFCKKTQPSFCMVFLYQAFHLFSEVPTTLCPYHVSALEVITNVIPACPNELQFSVLQTVLNTIIRHPSNSFFHLAALHLCEVLSAIPSICEQAAIIFVPPLIKETSDRTKGILHVAAFAIIKAFLLATTKNQRLHTMLFSLNDVVTFIRGDLRQYEELLTTSYGDEK